MSSNYPAWCRVHARVEGHCRPVSQDVCGDCEDPRARDAASHQHPTFPGDDVHFNVRAGQQARGPFEKRADIADVDHRELAPGAEAHARQRLVGVWRASGRAAAIQNASTQASRPVT
jgi:hypothetical protein